MNYRKIRLYIVFVFLIFTLSGFLQAQEEAPKFSGQLFVFHGSYFERQNLILDKAKESLLCFLKEELDLLKEQTFFFEYVNLQQHPFSLQIKVQDNQGYWYENFFEIQRMNANSKSKPYRVELSIKTLLDSLTRKEKILLPEPEKRYVKACFTIPYRTFPGNDVVIQQKLFPLGASVGIIQISTDPQIHLVNIPSSLDKEHVVFLGSLWAGALEERQETLIRVNQEESLFLAKDKLHVGDIISLQDIEGKIQSFNVQEHQNGSWVVLKRDDLPFFKIKKKPIGTLKLSLTLNKNSLQVQVPTASKARAFLVRW